MTTTTNMFEIATRNKLRWNYKGTCTTEDLWDLNLTALDGVYKTLNHALKETNEESLLKTKNKDTEDLELKINIVKYIVEVKMTEKTARDNQIAKSALREKYLKLIADKEDKALENLSVDELKNMVNNL